LNGGGKLADAQRLNAELIAQTARATAQAVHETAQAAANVLAHENNTALTEIAVLRTEFTALKEQYTSFEAMFNRKMDSLDAKFDGFLKELKCIAEGRPTWSVTWMLSGLLTVCGCLLTFIATHH
jgi:hypothetical protein